MKRLVLLLSMTLAACMPPVTFTARQPDSVAQQGTPAGDRPLTSTVGQYPAFSEYTQFARVLPSYQRWYHDVETCSGKKGDGLDGMRWLVAMSPLFRINGGPLVLGSYWRDGRTAMVGLGLEGDSLLIRHEMLHDVLGLPDSTDGGATVHPAAIFDTACASLVYSNRRP